MASAINWFEIPAKNFARAVTFYETILATKMELPFPDMKYAMFPVNMEKGEIGGGILEENGYETSENGPVVYLNGGEDLSIPLSRVEAAGGRITRPKTSIGANGFMAFFVDSEGNRMALHSLK